MALRTEYIEKLKTAILNNTVCINDWKTPLLTQSTYKQLQDSLNTDFYLRLLELNTAFLIDCLHSEQTHPLCIIIANAAQKSATQDKEAVIDTICLLICDAIRQVDPIRLDQLLTLHFLLYCPRQKEEAALDGFAKEIIRFWVFTYAFVHERSHAKTHFQTLHTTFLTFTQTVLTTLNNTLMPDSNSMLSQMLISFLYDLLDCYSEEKEIETANIIFAQLYQQSSAKDAFLKMPELFEDLLRYAKQKKLFIPYCSTFHILATSHLQFKP